MNESGRHYFLTMGQKLIFSEKQNIFLSYRDQATKTQDCRKPNQQPKFAACVRACRARPTNSYESHKPQAVEDSEESKYLVSAFVPQHGGIR